MKNLTVTKILKLEGQKPATSVQTYEVSNKDAELFKLRVGDCADIDDAIQYAEINWKPIEEKASHE